MKRKRLLMSFMTLLIAIVAVSTSTYAWFEMNKEVWVSDFGINVIGDEGIFLSVDGLNYTEKITELDLKKAIVCKYKNFSLNPSGDFVDSKKNVIKATEATIKNYISEIEMKPVTSLNGKTFYNHLGMNDKNIINPSDGNYVSFDIYFGTNYEVPKDTSLAKNIKIYLNSKDSRSTSNEFISATQIKSNTLENIKLLNKCNSYDPLTGKVVNHFATGKDGVSGLNLSVKDAMRFSIITESQSSIYELGEGLGSYATNLDETKYLINDEGNSPAAYGAKYDSSKNISYTYINSVAAGSSTALDYNVIPQTYKSLLSLEASYITTLNVSNNYIAKATFNIWVEGNDADCMDNIIGSFVECSFSFTNDVPEDTHEIEFDLNYETVNKIFDKQTLTLTQDNANNNGYYVTLPAIPLRSGYKFAGWYLEETCTNIFEHKNLLKPASINKTIIYAKWV